MKKQENIEVEEKTNMKKHEDIETDKKTNKKRSKLPLVIILLLLIAIIVVGCIYAIPIIKVEGIDGLLHPVKLNEDESKYYDLYVKEFEKYKTLRKENYNYTFRLYYFEGVNEPVVVLRHENWPITKGIAYNKVVIFYIKNGELITKRYDEVSNVRLLYNTTKDELDYYLVQVKDKEQYTYTLFKDIITESSNPYTVTISKKEEYATYKEDGSKVMVQKNSVAFIDDLEEYSDNLVHKQIFSYVDGPDRFKANFKIALTTRCYASDLITEQAREMAIERLKGYNVKPGEKILENDSSISSTNTNGNQNNTKPNTTKPTTKPNNTQTPQVTTKCNDGFVYVSDDNRCYSTTDVKNQINRCNAGEVDLSGDCGTAVDSSLCTSNPEQYEEMQGVCIDKYTLHTKSIECPAGYEVVYGSYSGKDFTGYCYRYMNPNN